MKVLIVGVTGFLGKALKSVCIDNGYLVWALQHQSAVTSSGLSGKLMIDDLEKLTVNFNYIFIASGSYQLTGQKLREANIELVERLSRQFPKSKLIFISSTEVYGDHQEVITEETKTNPVTMYGKAKLMAESAIKHHSKYAIVRLTVLFDKVVPNSSFLPSIIASAKSKKVIILTNNGVRLQDYLHVEDAAELCIKAAKFEENGIFLGTTGTSVSNNQVAEQVSKHLQNIQILYRGSDSVQSVRYDPRKTCGLLDWHPQIKLLDYLSKMDDT